MLTKTGAKLLDFGLAKLRATAGPISMSGMTQLATRAPETAHGMILGTVQYMAPEQVEGKEADARSDIWALGAVIYEMVTGRGRSRATRPPASSARFSRTSRRPSPRAQPLAPHAFDHLVRLCLAKEPDRRWQSAADIGRMAELISQTSRNTAERSSAPRVAVDFINWLGCCRHPACCPRRRADSFRFAGARDIAARACRLQHLPAARMGLRWSIGLRPDASTGGLS